MAVSRLPHGLRDRLDQILHPQTHCCARLACREILRRELKASGLNQLKCRVEALQLDAGIGGCKAPVSFDVMNIAVAQPGGDVSLEVATVRDAPIETLTGQDSELGLGHI